MNYAMKAIVTVKLTESELKNIIIALQLFNERSQAQKKGFDLKQFKALLKDFNNIGVWIDEKTQERINDKTVSEESIEGRIQAQTPEGVCVGCGD